MDGEKHVIRVLPNEVNRDLFLEEIQKQNLLFQAWLEDSHDGGSDIVMHENVSEQVDKIIEELRYKTRQDPEHYLRSHFHD